MIPNSEKGASLYLALVIMSLLLSLALGLSSITLSQLKTMAETGNAVIAYYAAETGIERAIYEKGAAGSRYEAALENNSSYAVDVIGPGEDCPGNDLCIKSVGAYKNTKRAIFLTR